MKSPAYYLRRAAAWFRDLLLAIPPVRRWWRARLLADATKWSTAECARALGVRDVLVRQWRMASLRNPEAVDAFPPPAPSPPREPRWQAGTVRQWAWNTGRLDHYLRPRQAASLGRPPRRQPTE